MLEYLTSSQVEQLRHEKFALTEYVKLLGKGSKLISLEMKLYKQLGIHLGESMVLVKAYKDKKTGRVHQLSDVIMDTKNLLDTWFYHFAGLTDDGALVIGKYFRAGGGISLKHYTLRNLKFVLTRDQHKMLIRDYDIGTSKSKIKVIAR